MVTRQRKTLQAGDARPMVFWCLSSKILCVFAPFARPHESVFTAGLPDCLLQLKLRTGKGGFQLVLIRHAEEKSLFALICVIRGRNILCLCDFVAKSHKKTSAQKCEGLISPALNTITDN